jgi:hypothetical protein
MASAKKKDDELGTPVAGPQNPELAVPTESVTVVAPRVDAKPAAKAAQQPDVERPAVKPEPAPAPAVQKTPAPAPAPTTRTYRVWAHGSFRRNGKRYAPGDTLELRDDDAAQIPCLERVS